LGEVVCDAVYQRGFRARNEEVEVIGLRIFGQGREIIGRDGSDVLALVDAGASVREFCNSWLRE
jgi:hypothetical protein